MRKDGIEILIPVYVDDGFLIGNNLSFIEEIISKLSKQIKLRSHHLVISAFHQNRFEELQYE